MHRPDRVHKRVAHRSAPDTSRPRGRRGPRGVSARALQLIIDSFCGGGGASLGIKWALGVGPHFGINHDDEAITMHEANHPETHHFVGDVYDADPEEVCAGRPVAMAWFSPNCTHFSRAKGGKPLDKRIRSLAWVVVRWAKAVRPKVIFLENVTEFLTWGPLDAHGKPDPKKRGQTFKRWLGKLRSLGYTVEWRELRGCDYGAPTYRKRLYLVARCDGEPIDFPAATHEAEQFRVAADCIDWSLPTPSIFERKKPLAEATLRRIARGIKKFVLESARPFLVPLTHQGDDRVHSVDEPFRTVTGANRGEIALVAPTLVQTGYGERPGQVPRALDITKPFGTVVAGGAKAALITAFLAKNYGGHEGSGAPLDKPMSTITCQDHHALVEVALGHDRREEVHAFLTKFYGTSTGSGLLEPAPTVTASGEHIGLVTVKRKAKPKREAAQLDLGLDRMARAKAATATPPPDDFTVTIDGVRYEIVDIGFRMLTPRELFRAQGFPDSYEIAPWIVGKNGKRKRLSKTAQIRMCGNSVCPQVAEALVRANVGYDFAVAAE